MCKYAPYLAATLLVEVNGFLLHQRKLLITAGLGSSSLFEITRILVWITLPTARIAPHAYLLYRMVALDWAIFPHWSTWLVAFLGLLAMNVLNIRLAWDFVAAERRQKERPTPAKRD
jgi:hypothetical protein